MFIKKEEIIKYLKLYSLKLRNAINLFECSEKNKIITLITIVLLAGCIFFYAINKELFNVALIGIIIIWLTNLGFGAFNIKERFIFFIMNLMIFVFVLSRPLISALRKEIWWYFDIVSIKLSLTSIFLTLLMILIGGIISSKKRLIRNNSWSFNKVRKNKIIYIFFIISLLAYLYTQISDYLYFNKMEYSNMYVFEKSYPVMISFLASLFKYFVFFLLARLPNKKESIFVLAMYILTSIPLLLLGSRSEITVRCIFSIVYVIFRHFYFSNNEIWIKKKYGIIFFAIGIILVLILGAYNYIRDGKEIEKKSPLYIFIDFFYKQGTTFDTICQGFENKSSLKSNSVLSYTFGDIIDYVKYNTISKKIFKIDGLKNGNSIEMATLSNSMAHHLSYLVLGDSYLKGHGRGTSYIIEVYMDFGFLGLCVYSILLGILFISLVRLFRSKFIILRYLVLSIISNIWLLPRYNATGFLSCIIKPQFWFIVAFIYFLEYLHKIRLIKNGGKK